MSPVRTSEYWRQVGLKQAARAWAARWKRAAKTMRTRWHQAETGLLNMQERLEAEIEYNTERFGGEQRALVDLAAAREQNQKHADEIRQLREALEKVRAMRWSVDTYRMAEVAKECDAALAAPAEPGAKTVTEQLADRLGMPYLGKREPFVPPEPQAEKKTREVREDGWLEVDRDAAVAKNMEAIKNMTRPGNVKQKAEEIVTGEQLLREEGWLSPAEAEELRDRAAGWEKSFDRVAKDRDEQRARADKAERETWANITSTQMWMDLEAERDAFAQNAEAQTNYSIKLLAERDAARKELEELKQKRYAPYAKCPACDRPEPLQIGTDGEVYSAQCRCDLEKESAELLVQLEAAQQQAAATAAQAAQLREALTQADGALRTVNGWLPTAFMPGLSESEWQRMQQAQKKSFAALDAIRAALADPTGGGGA